MKQVLASSIKYPYYMTKTCTNAFPFCVDTRTKLILSLISNKAKLHFTMRIMNPINCFFFVLVEFNAEFDF